MLKVVLTGGPCSGRSTVLELLLKRFRNHAVRVVDAEAVLREGGFPMRDGRAWRTAFERARAATQLALESVAQAEAAADGMTLLLLDGGLLDGAVHVASQEDFASLSELRIEAMLHWYDVVLHLESLAVTRPEVYGHLRQPPRFLCPSEAVAVDRRILRAWKGHPRQLVIGYHPTLEEKAERVAARIEAVRALRTRAA